MLNTIELDLHTHTIVSGHAYSTITEMAKEASEKGLKILGITDHAKGLPGTCEDIYFMNLGVVSRQLFGIELLLGAEINILNYEGELSLDEKCIKNLDIRIAGIHDCCYEVGTMEENTNAIVAAIKNPQVDVISHPDDGNCPLDYEKVVQAAKKYHTLLEINNNALRSTVRKDVYKNSMRILELCKEYEQPVLLSSDAHFSSDIANLENVEKVIDEANFPAELIINYSADKLREYLKINRENEDLN